MTGRTALRLAFMGTPEFAVAALEALIEAGHTVVCTYTQPPKPVGRGHQRQPSPVQATAERHGIEVRAPKTLRDPGEQARFAALDLDVAVVAAYGLILPAPILAAPRHGCINIHASLLPRWRGAAPIHRAILAGDRETGITIMRMDEGLDTGPMLLRRAVPIGRSASASSLHDTLAALGASMIVEALDGLAAGTLTQTAQPADGVTYASKLKKDEGLVDWSRPAADIARMVRAFTPWPGCSCGLPGGERLKIVEAAVVSGDPPLEADMIPGTIIDEAFTVACGQGALTLITVQRPGRGPTDGSACLRGLRLGPGGRLG